MMSDMGTTGIWQLFSAFFGIVLVIFLAYFLTRIYARKFGAAFGVGKSIKVIDKLPVGKASSIAIIELSGKQYMVGITENNITLLKELDDVIEIEEKLGSSVEFPSFVNSLKSAAKNLKGKNYTDEGENEDIK